MKRFYLFALAACALSFTANAQFPVEDMEFYTLGEMGTQNPAIWTSWTNDGGVTLDGFVVTDAQSQDAQSLLSEGGAPQRDPLLLLGNKTSGDYTVRWEFYIPTGQEGYFNIQGEIPPLGTPLAGLWNSGNIYFNEAGGNPGGITDTNGDLSSLSFPHDAWFTVDLYVDVDNLIYNLTVGGVTAPDSPFAADATLGGLNFFPGCSCSEMYVDNVLYVDGILAVTDVFAGNNFSVYPNPVTDILNIRSIATVDIITVYDVLGKLVLSTTPDIISPRIDMSALNSGVYLVRVTIGDASKTVKVIR
jgi:Secretion system C-terminal sorting domain